MTVVRLPLSAAKNLTVELMMGETRFELATPSALLQRPPLVPPHRVFLTAQLGLAFAATMSASVLVGAPTMNAEQVSNDILTGSAVGHRGGFAGPVLEYSPRRSCPELSPAAAL